MLLGLNAGNRNILIANAKAAGASNEDDGDWVDVPHHSDQDSESDADPLPDLPDVDALSAGQNFEVFADEVQGSYYTTKQRRWQ